LQSGAAEDNPTLSSEDTEDINTLASLVKLYLRELQDPLIPFESYEDFVGSIRGYQTEHRTSAERPNQKPIKQGFLPATCD
jgi:hypothetical protein